MQVAAALVVGVNGQVLVRGARDVVAWRWELDVGCRPEDSGFGGGLFFLP